MGASEGEAGQGPSSGGGDALLESLGVKQVEAEQLRKQLIEERLERSKGASTNDGGGHVGNSALENLDNEISTVKEVIGDIGQFAAPDADSEPLRLAMEERLKSLEEQKASLGRPGTKPGVRPHPSKSKRATIDFEDDTLGSALDASSQFVETDRDRLIRMGVLTPFHKMRGLERGITHAPDVERALRSAAARAEERTGSRGAVRLAEDEVPLHRGFGGTSGGIDFTGRRRKRAASKPRAAGARRKRGTGDWLRSDLGDIDLGLDGGSGSAGSGEEAEGQEDVCFDGGFRMSGALWGKLMSYQQTGVKWMWELHCQGCGGIMGDEMGLGKTVQVIAFLSGLLKSDSYKPALIVCPVTLMSHWVREFRRWAPAFQVRILHDSALSKIKRGAGRQMSNEALGFHVVDQVCKSSRGLLVTSYEQLRLKQDYILGYRWGYVVLDEGHKIRNPNIELTLVCKQLQTPHRVILSGTPIQNRLAEIWSLFDFVFPGKLGTLPVFTSQFAVPIQMGGYAHASKLQVTAAYKCALVLRDLISPYLLRRRKKDVDIDLPKKSEHVLFCLLTVEQQELYREYLASQEVAAIMEGKVDALAGIDVMKKICNHPDLLDEEAGRGRWDSGDPERSGKMAVLMKVVTRWRDEGHRTLLFSQTRQMLDLIERAVGRWGHAYLRMDGTTPVARRQALVDRFNDDTDVSVFCLTTRVGGLGLNLTGADRVVIFDPDWNPSTDLQAQERCWRIGQKNEVVVYRLVTSGTIEEKIYNRQIFKQFLTNKVLQDPKHRRAFQHEDICDLFVLGEEYSEGQNAMAKALTDVETQLMPDGLANNNAATNMAAPGSASPDQTESSMLRSLMDGDDIAKAVCHDKVMSAGATGAHVYDRKASEIADRAARAVRESRARCLVHEVSQPTWTGRAGFAGAPGAVPKRRFGKASKAAASQLLAAPSSTPHSEGGQAAGVRAGAPLTSSQLVRHLDQRKREAEAYGDVDAEARTLMESMIAYFAQNGHSVQTGCIVSQFRDTVGGDKVHLFKSILKTVAVQDAGVKGSGRATWTLKQEFRP